jgi:putative endonuclease
MEATLHSSVARGRAAEDVAAGYLEGRGWTVIARNLRTPVGELDLVCLDDHTTVVVEVKGRSGDLFGEALESIGPRKERRLRAATAWWMAENGGVRRGVRFDVIVICLDGDGGVRSLAHLRDVLGSGS